MTKLYVLDTTVLSNFAHIDRIDLLRLAVEDKGAITPMVFAELQAGEQTGRVPVADWAWLPITELSAEEATRLVALERELGVGEASCLAVAIARQATIATDDQAARRFGFRMGISITGTLGLLRTLIRKGHLTQFQADEILTEMLGHGYRSSVRSLNELDV